MTTKIRPEISKKNKYWISKHRYYELKHFCLQYAEWKKAYNLIEEEPLIGEKTDPTGDAGTLRAYYSKKMELVEQTAANSDKELGYFIFLSVTEGCTYENLLLTRDIPCSRGTFYDRRRRFFWILSRSK